MGLPDLAKDNQILDDDLWNLGRKFEIEQKSLRTALAEEAHYQRATRGKTAAMQHGQVLQDLIAGKFAPNIPDIDFDLLSRARRGQLERHYPSRFHVALMWVIFAFAGLAEMTIFGIQVFRGSSIFVLIPAAFLLLGGVLLGWAWKEEGKWFITALGLILILAVSTFRAWDEYQGFDWVTFLLLFFSGVAIGVFEAVAFEATGRRKHLRADQLRCQGWEANQRHRDACEKEQYKNLYLSFIEDSKKGGVIGVADALAGVEGDEKSA